MSLPKILLFYIAIACTQYISAEASVEVDNIDDLTLLGTINGKSFYLYGNSLTWPEARDYANSIGLKLAAFSTLDEANFIKNLPLSLLPEGDFWTSGTNSHVSLKDQFRSDTTGRPFSYGSFDLSGSYFGIRLYVGSGIKQLGTAAFSYRNPVLLQDGSNFSATKTRLEHQAHRERDETLPQSPLIPADPLQTHFLGTVNGKSFYAYYDTMMRWEDAKQFALSQGMNLAAFSTDAEANFIYNLPTNILPPGIYWTSGTNNYKQMNDHFIWDTTGEAFNSAPFGFGYSYSFIRLYVPDGYPSFLSTDSVSRQYGILMQNGNN